MITIGTGQSGSMRRKQCPKGKMSTRSGGCVPAKMKPVNEKYMKDIWKEFRLNWKEGADQKDYSFIFEYKDGKEIMVSDQNYDGRKIFFKDLVNITQQGPCSDVNYYGEFDFFGNDISDLEQDEIMALALEHNYD